MSVKDNEPAASAGDVKKLKKRIAQLEQILGKKSLQVDLLKDAIEIAREKKLISQQPLQVRVHDGNIITLQSNMRWCSDGFYIPCDNGERVQVAFSLGTCDREIMSYVASILTLG